MKIQQNKTANVDWTQIKLTESEEQKYLSYYFACCLPPLGALNNIGCFVLSHMLPSLATFTDQCSVRQQQQQQERQQHLQKHTAGHIGRALEAQVGTSSVDRRLHGGSTNVGVLKPHPSLAGVHPQALS